MIREVYFLENQQMSVMNEEDVNRHHLSVLLGKRKCEKSLLLAVTAARFILDTPSVAVFKLPLTLQISLVNLIM